MKEGGKGGRVRKGDVATGEVGVICPTFVFFKDEKDNVLRNVGGLKKLKKSRNQIFPRALCISANTLIFTNKTHFILVTSRTVRK